MPTIRLDVPEETVEKLDMETDLLGFEDIPTYLDWIIGNRAAIEQGTERDQLLSEYAARVAELEEQVAQSTTGDEPAATPADGDATAEATDGSATPESPGATDGTDSTDEQPATADGGGTANQTVETGGTGERMVPKSGPNAEPDDLGGNFTPERVKRFTDERLNEEADVLAGVEGERLDEFARRAVAQTRKRLGRDPATGLSYQSNTSIAVSSDDVSPGEDITDLEALDVPGRSPEKVEPRRRAVGAALAYLKDEDRARRSDFVEALYEEYPAGYGSESGWWNCIKTGLKQVDVVEGGDGARVWRFRRTEISNEAGTLRGRGPKRVVDSK
ncbi:hypothetical protein [Haloarchaeobius sp. FL176]|uniref:hypothetical protein n=1 Tax=Haloarchaeobius sp. FL176 TaxID=2967129 RepID=UPI0021494AD8|nr:hypothetical protein [Haloarchaeobius sp. FL176]